MTFCYDVLVKQYVMDAEVDRCVTMIFTACGGQSMV